MKHHVVERPIGKCKGCCLNMRTFCAAGLEPKNEWSRGRCRCRDDESVLERYYESVPATGRKAAKLRRRAKAVQVSTRTHENGRIPPGRQVPAAHSGA